MTAFYTWTWALTVLIVLVLIRWVGDRWWGVAVLLFVPRWLFLAPLPVLALASGLARRPRQWLLQGVVALVIAGPLMSVSLPIHQLWDPRVAGTRVRIMTLNRGMDPIDVDRLIQVIERERIDLICLQEYSERRDTRLETYLAGHGWYLNKGRLVASRYPIVAEMPKLPDELDTDYRYSVDLARVRVRVPGGVEFGLASVHMPTLRYGFYRFLEYDITGLKRHVAWWDRQFVRVLDGLAEMRDVPVLVGGDFNVPPDHAVHGRGRLALPLCLRGFGLGIRIYSSYAVPLVPDRSHLGQPGVGIHPVLGWPRRRFRPFTADRRGRTSGPGTASRVTRESRVGCTGMAIAGLPWRR